MMLEEYARTIIENSFGKSITSIRRFPTGLSHTVLDIVTEDDCPYVIRIARPERNAELERGIYWQEKLEDLDIPLPRIYSTGRIENHAYAVYERLPGSDLEHVYPFLSTRQKRDLAFQIAQIQQKIHSLNRQQVEPILGSIHPWMDVIDSIVERSEREILANGEESNPYIAHTRNQIRACKDDLVTVKPVAFLYDLSVRNVIVDKETVIGIIDVDSLWFGDPLLAIGQGKTILMMMQTDTDFISYWCQYLGLSERQLRLVDFYALLYSVRFMGTLGQKLNGNYSLQTDPKSAGLLKRIADEMLGNLGETAG
jgi:aminoglycoside phosphotransferase (APT) family kinase protein